MQRELDHVALNINHLTTLSTEPPSTSPNSTDDLSRITTATSTRLLSVTNTLRSLSIKAPILRGGGGKAFVSTSETYQVRAELNRALSMLAASLKSIKQLAGKEGGRKRARIEYRGAGDATDEEVQSLVQESDSMSTSTDVSQSSTSSWIVTDLETSQNNTLDHPFASLALVTADLDLSFLRPSRTVSFEVDSQQSNWINVSFKPS